MSAGRREGVGSTRCKEDGQITLAHGSGIFYFPDFNAMIGGVECTRGGWFEKEGSSSNYTFLPCGLKNLGSTCFISALMQVSVSSSVGMPCKL